MRIDSSDAAAWAAADAETVFFILDAQFGNQLLALPTTSAIWLVDSALNTPVAKQFWRTGHPAINAGQSTFTYSPSSDAADFFESMLITIHDHHGPSSHWGGYSTLIVVGLPITETVKEILANDNLQISCITESGFVAKRIAS
jgi:hypothetical protein